MTFTVTARHTGTTGTANDQPTLASNSVTPSANSLILVGYCSQNNNHEVLPSLGAATGGPSLTLIGKAGDVTNIPWGDTSTAYAQGGCAYYGAIGGTPSAFAFTVDPWSTTNVGAMSVLAADVTGHNASTPIVRSATNGSTLTSGDTNSGTVTLASTPTSGNLLIVFVFSGADGAGAPASPTAGAGKTFSTVATISGAYQPIGIFSRVCDGTESATITCADLGTAVGAFVMVAAEIAPDSAAANSGPNTAGAAADLGGGSGSWVNPTNAQGAANTSYAVWTAP